VAIRATINLVQIQASTSIVKVEAQTTYEKTNATGIWIDPDSNNRMPKEELPLADVQIRVLTKVLEDTATIEESKAFDFITPKSDTLGTLVENFMKAVSYKRNFTDTFTLDDASQIDKDFYGNKGNIFSIMDIIGLDQSKVLTDSYTFSEVITVALLFERDFTDTATVQDVASANIIKALTDSFSLDDGLYVDKDYYGSKGDGLNFTEILDTNLGKGISDIFTFTEEHGLQLSKTFTGTDTFSIGDTVSINRVSGRVLNGAALNVATIN